MAALSVIAFIASVFCIHATGRAARKLLRIDDDGDPLHSFLVSCALGMMLLSGLAFLLLATGIGYRVVFAVIVYAGGIYGFITARGPFFSAFKEIGKTAFATGRPLRRLFAYLIIFFLLLTFYITLAPTTAWDALTYHYPLPARWLEAHSFVNIPEIIYSDFPSSAELIFIYGFAAYSDTVANQLTWFAGFLCVLYLFYLGRKHLSVEAGLGAAIIFLSYPVVYIEGLQGGYIDLVQTFYIFAMLDALYEWSESGRWLNIVLAGLFSGFLMCIKHSGVLTFAFALIYLIYAGYKKLTKFSTIAGAILILIALTWILPLGWYIKSQIYTGNPLYPFLYYKFGGVLSSAPDIMYWANPTMKAGFILTVLYPIFATFDVPMVQLAFRLLPPSIIVLIPFLFIRFRHTGFRDFLLGYVIYFIVLISIVEPSEPRYNLAAWALLAILSLDAAFHFSARAKWLGRIIIPIAIIIPLAVGSVVLSARYVNYRHKAIWTAQPRDEYYLGGGKHVPLDCYPMMHYLNGIDDDGAKILLAEPRVFVLDDGVNYTIAYPFQTDNLWDWNKISYKELPGLLDEYGFTYIAVTYGPNYRGLCEAWFIMNLRTEVDPGADYASQPDVEPGMGNMHYMRLAAYSNPHLTYEEKPGWDPRFLYDGRFKSIDDLFASEGNIDVKLAASIIWLAREGYIERAFTSPYGLVYRIVE